MQKYIGEHFPTIQSLLRANERPVNNVFASASLSSDERGNREWYGTESYQEAVDLMTNGFDDPVSEIRKGVETNINNTAITKTAVKTDVVGFAPCVPNALLGLPNSMLNKDIAVKKSKVISIVYDVTGSCVIDKERFIKAGVTLLSAVSTLEMNGYRVELKAAFFNAEESSDGQRVYATLTLKDWRQPLDVKKLTFIICHASMLRRIGFRYLETLPTLEDTGYRWGYGRSRVTVCGDTGVDTIRKELKNAGLLKDNERYTNMLDIENGKHDPHELLVRLGLVR